MLIDIFDYQDVLVLRFPAEVASREISTKLGAECGDAMSFFEPAGVVVDLTRTTINRLLFVAVFFLTSLSRKWGCRLAFAGKKNEMETLLGSFQMLNYTVGCFDTVQEAIDVLRLPPTAA